jgi:cell division protein ZipA
MESISDTNLLRIGIAIAAFILIGIILVTGRKKPAQGVKTVAKDITGDTPRVEPTLKNMIESDADHEAKLQAADANVEAEKPTQGQLDIGSRQTPEFDKVVSILIAARAGQALLGPDLVVAAEKAGLIYGHRNIFHRMVEKHPEKGPVFSVANLLQPGTFDLRMIKELKTPGIHFFITLPAPMNALDAWDVMLPTAQRMAELLDAIVLDDKKNALGRQGIAHIREDLRNYDRQREKLNIKPGN